MVRSFRLIAAQSGDYLYRSALMTSYSGLIPSADVNCDGTYKGTLDNNNSDKYSAVVTCQLGEV